MNSVSYISGCKGKTIDSKVTNPNPISKPFETNFCVSTSICTYRYLHDDKQFCLHNTPDKDLPYDSLVKLNKDILYYSGVTDKNTK